MGIKVIQKKEIELEVRKTNRQIDTHIKHICLINHDNPDLFTIECTNIDCSKCIYNYKNNQILKDNEA